jgi:hypothetical protein
MWVCRKRAAGRVKSPIGVTEVSRQTCRSRWRLRRRELSTSRDVEPYLTPEVFEARRCSPVMRAACRKMAAWL